MKYLLLLLLLPTLLFSQIVGQVVDTENNPQENATVSLFSCGIRPPVHIQVVTGENGTFGFRIASPGIYILRVRKEGYIPSVTRFEANPRRAVEFLVVLTRIREREEQATGSITGRATTRNGNPVAELTLLFTLQRVQRERRDIRIAPFRTITDENGEFSFQNVPVGIYKIRIRQQCGYNIPDIEVIEGENTHIEILIREPRRE